MSIYRVVEKTPHGTRYYCGSDVFTRTEGDSLEMTEGMARNKAAELNERYAAEATWCRYDARPAKSSTNGVRRTMPLTAGNRRSGNTLPSTGGSWVGAAAPYSAESESEK